MVDCRGLDDVACRYYRRGLEWRQAAIDCTLELGGCRRAESIKPAHTSTQAVVAVDAIPDTDALVIGGVVGFVVGALSTLLVVVLAAS